MPKRDIFHLEREFLEREPQYATLTDLGFNLPHLNDNPFDLELPDDITVREFQITDLRSRGLTSAKIYADHHIHPSTITRDSKSLQDKMSAPNYEAVVFNIARLGVLPILELPKPKARIGLAGACVLYLVGQGKSDEEIAEIREIELPTVSGHIKEINLTLGTFNALHALRAALQSGQIIREPIESFENEYEAIEKIEEVIGGKKPRNGHIRSPEVEHSIFTLLENKVFNLMPYGVSAPKIARILHYPLSYVTDAVESITSKLEAVNFENAVYIASGSNVLPPPESMPDTQHMSYSAAYSLYLQATGLSLEEIAETRKITLKSVQIHRAEAFSALGVDDELSAIRLAVHVKKIPYPAIRHRALLEKWLEYLNPNLQPLQIERLDRISFGETVAEIMEAENKNGKSVSRSLMSSTYKQLGVSGAEEAVRRGFATGYLKPSREYAKDEVVKLKKDLKFILDHVSRGEMLKTIADEKGWHKKLIHEKQRELLDTLGAKNLAHAVRIAIEMGILNPEYPKKFRKNSAMIRPARGDSAGSV